LITRSQSGGLASMINRAHAGRVRKQNLTAARNIFATVLKFPDYG